ncbi:MAG: hypothetical protein NZ781_07520 [Armatimonadetes bacterium]|nr:hypothetical protein [Armatimonadota bacterium]
MSTAFGATLEEDCDPSFNVAAQFLPTNQWAKGTVFKAVLNQNSNATGYVVTITATNAALNRLDGNAQRRIAAAQLPKETQIKPWRLTIQRRDAKDKHRIAVVVNGAPIIIAHDDKYSGGRVCYEASNDMFKTEPRYQPIEPVCFMDDFMRRAEEPSAWETVSGNWSIGQTQTLRTSVGAPEPLRTANAFAYYGKPTDKAIAISTVGYWFWDTYTVDVSMRADGDGAVGIISCYQDSNNYIMFRLASRHSAKRAELVSIVDGAERVMSSAPIGYEPKQWYRMTMRFNESVVEAFVDGVKVCEAKRPQFIEGNAGLCIIGTSACFDDFAVMHWDGSQELLPASYAKIAQGFQREETMAQWASPIGDWVKRQSQDGSTYLEHRGLFFGDVSVSIPIGLRSSTGELKVSFIPSDALSGQGSSCTLRLHGLTYELLVDNKVSSSGKLNIDADSLSDELGFKLIGEKVSACINGGEIAKAQLGKRSRGYKLALVVNGFNIQINAIRVWATNVIDDTFANAPTLWWAWRGEWSTAPRWACDPSWGWFGGGVSECPTLWSKPSFNGDIVVEAFMTIAMDLPRSPGYSHPSDLNLTICGDGLNLDSGYSFIFAGWRNTLTAMLRKDKIVASTNEFRMINPTSSNPDFHRHWFYIRVEKLGSKLRYFVDDKLAIEYEDSKPIGGGKVALWTFHNMLMVARVRIWYERMEPPSELPCTCDVERTAKRAFIEGTPTNPSGKTVAHDFEKDACGWSGKWLTDGAIVMLDDSTASTGKRSLKVLTPKGGGHFTVWAGIGAFDAAQYPLLKFDYKVPPSVKVNLYIRAFGNYYAIEFTGGEQPDGTTPLIGKVENVIADGKWHTATVRLYDFLKKLFPWATSIPVSEICFAVPDETYLRCGIGGNRAGDYFNIDNFRVIASQDLRDAASP